MKAKRILFFATRDDLKMVLTDVESQEQLKYVLEGAFEINEVLEYRSLIGNPLVDKSNAGTSTLCHIFMVVPNDIKVEARKVPQRKGGVLYFVDSDNLDKPVRIRPGGVFKEGIIIEGVVDMMTGNPDSERIFELFKKATKQHFKKIHQYWVGPEAKACLEKGWRLTQAEAKSEEYDLKKK